MKVVTIKSGVLVALAVVVTVLCYFSPAANTSGETDVVLFLPDSIPHMESEMVLPSAHEKKSLPTNTSHIKRTYFPEGEGVRSYNAVSVSLIISGGDGRSLHRPQVCLDGQGWSIPYREIRHVEIDGQTLPIMDLHLSREVEGQTIEAHYYYCWIGKGITIPSYGKMRWISLVDNFSKNLSHRWGYPGVFTLVNPHSKEPQKEAWERASHVIKNVTPHFHKKFGAKEKSEK